MRAHIGLVILLLGLPGCADEPGIDDITITGTPTGESRGDDEFWFIHITGDQTRTPGTGASCAVAWSWEADLEKKEIRYQVGPDNPVGQQPTTLIGAAVWDASSCPIAYSISGDGRFYVSTRGLPPFHVQAHDDGSVEVAGHIIQPGQAIRLQGHGTAGTHGESWRFEDDVTVYARGAWPRSGLNAAE